MDLLILQGAIVALFGALSAVARVAWVERGTTISSQQKRLEYYEGQLIPTLNRVMDASEKGQTGLAILTRVVEENLDERRRRD